MNKQPLAFNHFNNNHVNYSDIVSLSKAGEPKTRSEFDVYDNISCLTSENNDTLLYVFNKPEGGWIIYSSDTRVPAVVAESTYGTFDELMEVEPARVWIEAIKEDMKIIKSLDDAQLNFTTAEIMSNKEFWLAIASPDEFIASRENPENSSATLAGPGVGGSGGFLPPGHYELFSTSTYNEVYDSIPRLTETDWHQDLYYNFYCPFRSDFPSLHAPAGCGPIAAAQILYFLNKKIGYPEKAPSTAYVKGNVESKDYNWGQSDHNTSIWDEMNSNSKKAAPLIAEIGRLLGIKYENKTATSYMKDYPTKVFNHYGIGCSHVDFDADKVRTSLLNKMPVMVGAIDKIGKGGHAFIMDCYRRSRKVTINRYEWVYDSKPPVGTVLPRVEPKEEYVYGEPYFDMVGINWGWGAYANQQEGKNNTWYSLTEDWVVSGYNYNTQREMIYGFYKM